MPVEVLAEMLLDAARNERLTLLPPLLTHIPFLGNTRVISQTALDHFRTSLGAKVNDPYAVVLKKNKLPMSLLLDSTKVSI